MLRALSDFLKGLKAKRLSDTFEIFGSQRERIFAGIDQDALSLMAHSFHFLDGEKRNAGFDAEMRRVLREIGKQRNPGLA